MEAIPFFSDVVIVSDGGSGRRTEMVVGCAAGEHGLMQLDIERDSVVVNSSSHGLLGEYVVNPRRACAARVTVVVLCVCVCVCQSTALIC